MSISLGGVVAILFFLFVVFLVILPSIGRRQLAAARQNAFRSLKKKRGSVSNIPAPYSMPESADSA
jgi:hypothetical protein